MSFGSRLAPGSPPGAILERFSSLRGAILERFWKDFRALGKLSSELSGLCVGPPSATFFPDTHAREEDTGETQEEHTREEEHARDTGGRRQNQRRNTPELREEHERDTGGAFFGRSLQRCRLHLRAPAQEDSKAMQSKPQEQEQNKSTRKSNKGESQV